MSDQSLIQIDQILLTFPSLDPVKIETIVSYDSSKQLLEELIGIFDTEMVDKINLIKQEFTHGNIEEMGKLAHRIRSTSLNLGATRLAEIFKRIEYLSAEHQLPPSEIQFLIQSAEKEYHFVSAKLQEQLKTRAK